MALQQFHSTVAVVQLHRCSGGGKDSLPYLGDAMRGQAWG